MIYGLTILYFFVQPDIWNFTHRLVEVCQKLCLLVWHICAYRTLLWRHKTAADRTYRLGACEPTGCGAEARWTGGTERARWNVVVIGIAGLLDGKRIEIKNKILNHKFSKDASVWNEYLIFKKKNIYNKILILYAA